MILIKSIQYVQTAYDIEEISLPVPPEDTIRVMTEDGPTKETVRNIYALVKGRRFVRPSDGEDIVIGCYPEVEKLLGMQYDAWEGLEEALASERRVTETLLLVHRELKQANLWTRFKWVFTGVK